MASSGKPSPQHKVFINFEGDALSRQFVGHLVGDLKSNLCIDVEKGSGDFAEIVQRIIESKIALVIISSMYTNSSCCLNELVEITRRVEEGKLVAIPILYKLDASVVKGLEGDFGLNLWNNVKRTSEFDKLKKWKEALDFISNKLTLALSENSDEPEFISAIVKEVNRQLIRISTDQFEKIPDQLSDQQKYALTEDAKFYENPEKTYFYGKSRKDDNLPDKANSNASPLLQNIAESRRLESAKEEKKYVQVRESSTMANKDKHVAQHQVFINFHGKDVRFSFLSHLKSALFKKGVSVFEDNDEKRGEEDNGELFKKIQDSKIALVVFSSTYPESTWCLDELVKIKECMDKGELKVIPILYKVEQSEVQQQKGDFGGKLWDLWRLHRDHHIIKWKEALESVASLEVMMRLGLEDNCSEAEFVASIVEEVNKVLTKISLQQGENPSCCQTGKDVGTGEKPESFPNKDPLFGMEKRIEQLEQKLEFDSNETRIIGVVGMPGIGKTTLAMMLHQKWNCEFIRCVPLLGIHKKWKDYGPVWLRTTLIQVLLGGDIPVIKEEITHDSVRTELLQTKVFVVLDDVSDKKQFEYLLGDLNWLKKGSKIVITTCDKSLLEGLANDTYLVPRMDNKAAFQLISHHAHDDQISCPPGESLSRLKKFVDRAGGNPLALKLMGSKLCGKDKSISEDNLQRVTKISKTKILDVWKFYIDQLNKKQKDVFLDIVWFFKSEDAYFVRSILDSGDPDSIDAVSEVMDLADKFLITISDSRIEMNDLVYTFGKHLGSAERHELWKYKDIINKLGKMDEIDAYNVRGIFLNMSEVTNNISLEHTTFTNMQNLRYLKIYGDSWCPQLCKADDCKLNFRYGLEFPLKEVRYLHWEKFPLEEMPSDFKPENLVHLRLPYSKLKRVWEASKDTPRLKWVDLSHSRQLLDLSGLSKAENIQRLNLEGCTILDELPLEIQSMKSLVFLNLRGCIRLWSLPKMNLTSLKILILSDCSNLKEFQLISESIEFLHLDGTAINRLPPTMKNLHRLVLLNLKNCKLLKCLPKFLGKLKDLEELILSGCSSLKNILDVKHSMKHLLILRLDGTGANEIPNISSFTRSEGQESGSHYNPSEWPQGVNEVSSLGRLCLGENDFVSLPADISKLYSLKWLNVKNCKKLKSLPMLPPRLQYFDAHECSSLESVSNPLALQLLTEHSHATFNFSNCKKLDLDAKESIISYTRRKSQLVLDALSRYNRGFHSRVLIGTCFPGWKVPTWFSHRAFGSMLKAKLPQHWCDNKFTGIALCAVILFSGNHDHRNHLLVKCNFRFKNEDGSHIRFSFTVGGWSEPGNTPQKIESSHVFIGYVSRMDINKHGVRSTEEGCIYNEVSLEFQVTDGTEGVVGCEVLKCGLSLLYASDERDEKAVVIPKRVEKLEILSFVGVELRLKQLEKVLYSTPGKTRIIGITGEHGIGKTTLATILFKKRGCKFPVSLFLRISKEHRPERLRRTFLKELLKQVNKTTSDKTTHGCLKDKLLQRKSFIVLDGVRDKKQLECLLGDLVNWIKKGSKILITTQDMSFLEGFAHDTYVVPKLNRREAFQLFSYYAFEDQISCPKGIFFALSRIFVDNTVGNPLALKLLGKELCEKDEAYWEYKMQTMTNSSNTKIQDVGRSSIDQLNQQHKDVFLDIVCFFRSEDEYFVRSLLDSENLDSIGDISEVRDLANRNLIEISDGRVETNDLVHTFAKFLDSHGRYTLLNYQDIIDKLKNLGEMEASNVRGVFVDMSEVTKRIVLEPMTFSNMRKLRYLKIYDSSYPRQCKADCKLYFPDGLRFPLKEVRYLHWLKFPLRELPSDFIPEKLVDLRLPYSMIARVWEGTKETPWLRWVDLSHSSQLLNISALSKAENLKRLNLEGCTMLDELPPEIQNMKSLAFLNLRGCIRLGSLPKMKLNSLKTLILSGCTNLEEFEPISESLEFLHLDGTSIKELPRTIKTLQRLVLLNLRNCRMLKFLPYSLCELKFLEELVLSGCSMLQKFPNSEHSMNHLQILLFDGTRAKEMPKMSCLSRCEEQASGSFCSLPRDVSRVSLLQRLCLSGNGFVSLETDMCQLYHLKWLEVKHCKRLRSIPVLPPRLEYFDAHGCDSLERVANPLALSVVTEHMHATFNFANCNKLDQDAKDSIISYTRQKSQLVLDALSRNDGGIASDSLIGTCFPGWEVPAWFSHQASGSVLEQTLPPHWFDNRFTGIALCAVIQFPGICDQSNLSVNCHFVVRNGDGICIPFSCTIGGWSESSNIPQRIESSHVFIGYVPRLDVNKQEEGCAFDETSLQFQVTDSTGEVVVGCEVLKSGFNLVYAPDHRENIQWDAKTVAMPKMVVNVPGETAKKLGKSRSDTDLQYQSYGKLRADDVQCHVITEVPTYQSCRNLNPERVKNVLGEVTHFGKTRKNHDIKYQPYVSPVQRRSSINVMQSPFEFPL